VEARPRPAAVVVEATAPSVGKPSSLPSEQDAWVAPTHAVSALAAILMTGVAVVGHFLVRDLLKQVVNAVEPRALLVVGLNDEPGRLGDPGRSRSSPARAIFI
jgi:hypothetical protein